MVNNKTGGLFRIAIRLMQLESPCSRYTIEALKVSETFHQSLARNYVSMAELSKIFQIRDDYKNLLSDDYAEKRAHAKTLLKESSHFLLYIVSMPIQRIIYCSVY